MHLRLMTLLFASCFANAVLADRPLIHDDYASAKHETRKPSRGDWKIENGVASVTQDDELYKKHKNHGPIMVYNVSYDDAVAEVAFNAKGCKSVVFTMDAEAGGHAFRVKLSPKTRGSILTYIKGNGKPKATPVFLSRELPLIEEGTWTTLKVKVAGAKATVILGDKTFDVQHEQIDQKKKIAKLGFAFGSLRIRQFDLTAL